MEITGLHLLLAYEIICIFVADMGLAIDEDTKKLSHREKFLKLLVLFIIMQVFTPWLVLLSCCDTFKITIKAIKGN